MGLQGAQLCRLLQEEGYLESEQRWPFPGRARKVAVGASGPKTKIRPTQDVQGATFPIPLMTTTGFAGPVMGVSQSQALCMSLPGPEVCQPPKCDFHHLPADEMYEILSNLPESVAYTCINCTEQHPAEWRLALGKELQLSVRQVLVALLNSRTTSHLLRYRQVGLPSCTLSVGTLQQHWQEQTVQHAS